MASRAGAGGASLWFTLRVFFAVLGWTAFGFLLVVSVSKKVKVAVSSARVSADSSSLRRRRASRRPLP
jgi:hypothetical protein